MNFSEIWKTSIQIRVNVVIFRLKSFYRKLFRLKMLKMVVHGLKVLNLSTFSLFNIVESTCCLQPTTSRSSSRQLVGIRFKWKGFESGILTCSCTSWSSAIRCVGLYRLTPETYLHLAAAVPFWKLINWFMALSNNAHQSFAQTWRVQTASILRAFGGSDRIITSSFRVAFDAVISGRVARAVELLN